MPKMKITQLRSEIYHVFDEVIQTGVPVEIERNGHIVKIQLEEKKSKLANLKPHDCIIGDPADLPHIKVENWHGVDHL